jgi:hypothetical protein
MFIKDAQRSECLIKILPAVAAGRVIASQGPKKLRVLCDGDVNAANSFIYTHITRGVILSLYASGHLQIMLFQPD